MQDPRKPKRASVTSSQIKSIGHTPEHEELEVEFNNGNVYVYYGVSEGLHRLLMGAESIGKFFNSNIRGKFPYKKLEPEPPAESQGASA